MLDMVLAQLSIHLDNVRSWLAEHPAVAAILTLSGVLVAAFVAHAITRSFLLPLLGKIATRSRTAWDEILVDEGVFSRLSWLVPLIIFHLGLELVPHLPDEARDFLARFAICLMILATVRGIAAMLGAVNTIYVRSAISRNRPIKGYTQAVSIIVHIVGGLLIISGLLGQSPWYLLSGIGAMTAIFMLVFRDTLLGLVAGIQLTSNDLVRVNDWIEMPEFGADGDVIDIALNTVKVLNWDKTITVIPSHKFLDHSFKNWRTMHELGGRRIKRALNIDMSTVRFLREDEIERFGRYALLKPYFEEKIAEIAEYNQKLDAPPDCIPNHRRLTNVGTFRAYTQAYLRNHPKIHQQLTFLIRQLQPTPQGLPLEIYVFCNDTNWGTYEGVQSDIFDHLLAMVPQFGLRIFQEPTGHDFVRFAQSQVDPVATKPDPQRPPTTLSRK